MGMGSVNIRVWVRPVIPETEGFAILPNVDEV